jgi:hypothetical protein
MSYSVRMVTRLLTGSTALRHLRVAIDLPEAGDQTDVPDDLRPSDLVAEVLDVRRVPLELQVADAPTERAPRGSCASCQDAPGYRVTAGACGTADLDKVPVTCL